MMQGKQPTNINSYAERIRESKGYKGRISFTREYLKRQLFLGDDEIGALDLEARFRPLPMRLMVELAIGLTSYEFGRKYGVSCTEINPTQIIRDIEELEDGHVARDSMKPVHHEYVSLWARELEKLFGEVEKMERQFPPQAYESEGETMREKMGRLFG